MGAVPHPNHKNARTAASARAAFPYPNDGIVESAGSARAAANHFARKHMLSHFILPSEGVWGRCPHVNQSP